MLYTFRWTCQQAAVRITVEVNALDDHEAGTLAALMLKDLSLGHGRLYDWRPEVGVHSGARA